MRLDRAFSHRLILTPLASYVGLAGIGVGAWGLLAGSASLWWCLPLLLFTYLILMGVTVGQHRLFCHQSFETSRFWHWVLAYLGTLAVYGSTVQWPAMHMTHHLYADTDRDPHYTGWRYLFWKKNRETEFNRRVLTRLWRDPMHRFFHRYYVLVVAATVTVLWVASPWALVFCYLAPLGWLHLVGSLHQVYAHGSSGPRSAPLLEVLAFTGGEWLHEAHHAWPKRKRFGFPDAGYGFIRLIERRAGA